MTGIDAAILYSRAHRNIDPDWDDDVDEDIIELLQEERIEYDPLRDMLYANKDT